MKKHQRDGFRGACLHTKPKGATEAAPFDLRFACGESHAEELPAAQPARPRGEETVIAAAL